MNKQDNKEQKAKLFSFRYLFYDIVKITAGIPGLIWHRPKLIYENENAKKKIKGGALVISNHLGFFDPVYLHYAFWYRRLHFICLKDFFEGKSAWFFKRFQCIPIDKNNFNVGSFKIIVNHLKQDELVVMFPEGQVSDGSEEMAAFKSGMVLMAIKSGKPIVPTYIKKKENKLERIKIIIGEPIKINSSTKSFAKIDEITKQLEEKTNNLKQIITKEK